jgi:hypothetical protein
VSYVQRRKAVGVVPVRSFATAIKYGFGSDQDLLHVIKSTHQQLEL